MRPLLAHCRCETAIEYDSYDVQKLNEYFRHKVWLARGAKLGLERLRDCKMQVGGHCGVMTDSQLYVRSLWNHESFRSIDGAAGSTSQSEQILKPP